MVKELKRDAKETEREMLAADANAATGSSSD